MDHSTHKKKASGSFWKNPIVIVGLLGIGYWLYTYHPQHALGFLPYAILLLCPIMHIFMHGGHGHGHSGHGDAHSESSNEKPVKGDL